MDIARLRQKIREAREKQEDELTRLREEGGGTAAPVHSEEGPGPVPAETEAGVGAAEQVPESTESPAVVESSDAQPPIEEAGGAWKPGQAAVEALAPEPSRRKRRDAKPPEKRDETGAVDGEDSGPKTEPDEKGPGREVEEEEGEGTGLEPMVELLGFRAGGEEFAVRITDVDEILRMQNITRIPRTPPFLIGVTSLRGRMIPVLDLKQKLSLSFMTPTSARILIMGGQDSPFGLGVDSVIGVIRVKPEGIRPPLETLEEEQARFIEGVVMVERGFVSLLDLESIAHLEFEVGV